MCPFPAIFWLAKKWVFKQYKISKMHFAHFLPENKKVRSRLDLFCVEGCPTCATGVACKSLNNKKKRKKKKRWDYTGLYIPTCLGNTDPYCLNRWEYTGPYSPTWRKAYNSEFVKQKLCAQLCIATPHFTSVGFIAPCLYIRKINKNGYFG